MTYYIYAHRRKLFSNREVAPITRLHPFVEIILQKFSTYAPKTSATRNPTCWRFSRKSARVVDLQPRRALPLALMLVCTKC